MAYYIEDIVRDVVRRNRQHLLPKTDFLLFVSINKQFNKNLALTKKQYELIVRKINENYTAFLSQYDNLDIAIHNVKYPFRHVDKSKHVTFSTRPDNPDDHNIYIAITFPYSSANMRALNFIINNANTFFIFKHEKTHYVLFSEKNVVMIVEKLRKMNFVIDNKVLMVYNKIMEFDKKQCCPLIENGQLYNMVDELKDHLTEKFGKLTNKTALIYYDRSMLYGYSMDMKEVEKSYDYFSSTSIRIVKRKKQLVHLNTKEHSLGMLFNALTELKRYPTIVLMTKKYLVSNLRRYISTLLEHMDSQEIAVYLPSLLMDNDAQQLTNLLNEYSIPMERNSNTKVAFATLVSYDNLLFSDWKPESIVLPETTQIMAMSKFLRQYRTIDLVVYYAETLPNQLVSVCNRLI